LLSHEELEKIPRRYRWLLKLLLKLPSPSFPDFVTKKLPGIEGIYWAVIVPILMIAYFYLSFWSVSFFSEHLAFPFNILPLLSVPAILLVILVRTQLERAIVLLRSLKGSNKDWNVSRVAAEFEELLRRQRAKEQHDETEVEESQ
jgi:hypothetical protein